MRVGEEPLLGYEQRPLSVGLDASALEDEAIGGVGSRRLDSRQLRDPLDRAADLGVVREVGIFRPAVERPVHQTYAPRLVVDERGRRIAEPDAVVRDEMQPHPARDVVRPQLLLTRRAHLGVVAENLDTLVLGEHARDLRVHPRNGPQLPWPVRLVVWPGDPGSVMGRPFWGKGEGKGHAGELVRWLVSELVGELVN